MIDCLLCDLLHVAAMEHVGPLAAHYTHFARGQISIEMRPKQPRPRFDQATRIAEMQSNGPTSITSRAEADELVMPQRAKYP